MADVIARAQSSLQESGQRFQEALVLRLRADRHAQRARAAQRAPPRTSTPRSAVPHHAARALLAQRRTRRSWPATRRARARVPAARPRARCARRGCARRGASTSSWWLSASTAAAWAAALQKNGWRTWSTAVGRPPSRTARSRRAARRARRPWRMCAAARGWGACRAAAIDVVGVLQHVELAVGLVEDHARRGAGRSRRTSAISSSGSAVEVGLFGLHTITRRVAAVISSAHLVELVAMLVVERHLDRARARGGGEVRVDPERRPGVDQLGARLEQRVAGGEQDVARAVADRDPLRGTPCDPTAACAARRWVGSG